MSFHKTKDAKILKAYFDHDSDYFSDRSAHKKETIEKNEYNFDTFKNTKSRKQRIAAEMFRPQIQLNFDYLITLGMIVIYILESGMFLNKNNSEFDHEEFQEDVEKFVPDSFRPLLIMYVLKPLAMLILWYFRRYTN